MAVAMPALHRENIVAPLWAYVSELFHRALIVSQYAGCLILWYGSAAAAVAGVVPPGVTCWLTTGPWFLLYQEDKLREAAMNSLTPVEFWRRVSMVVPVWMHLGFNILVWIPLWGSVILGKRELSDQDILGFCFCVASVAAIALTTALLHISWKTPWVLFLYALCTRVVEQGAVAFSGSVALLPEALVNGLLIVAAQIVSTTFLEFSKARHNRKKSLKALKAYRAISWTLLSTLFNLAAAVLIWYKWQAA